MSTESSHYDEDSLGFSTPSFPTAEDVKDQAVETYQIRKEHGRSEDLWKARRDLQDTASAYLSTELGLDRGKADRHASEVAVEATLEGAHIYDALEKIDAWSNMQDLSEQNQSFAYSDGVWLC